MQHHRFVPVITLVIALVTTTSLGACAARQAAWERPRLPPAASAPTGDLAADLDVAEQHWARRDDRDAVLAAIAAWERVLEQEPAHIEALVALSRAHYFYVDGHLTIEQPDDLEALQLLHHERGADYGERALMAADPAFERAMRGGADFMDAIGRIERPAVAAAFWYCSNLGRFSVVKGLSAKLFYKDRVAAAMQRILELAPEFFHAGADRYLGAFYAALPGIAGKDLERSARHFAAATKRAPAYLGNPVVEAEFLAVERDDEPQYRKLLERALSADANLVPEIGPENRAAQRNARRLLQPAAIDERF